MQKTIDDIRAAHERLLGRLEEETKRLEADLGKAPADRKVTADQILKEKRTVLNREKERLADAAAAKEQAVARFDTNIARIETTIKRLEKELADDSKTAGGGTRTRGNPDTKTTSSGPTEKK